MIFLPPVHISPEKSIPIDHAKFVLGNQLYFMHWESHLPIKCKMKSVDLQTFKVSSVEVRFENGVEDKVPSVYEAVVVQRDKAFFWDYSDNFLLEGRVDAEGFHWRKINTTGPKPPIGESLAYDEGSGNVMCVLAEGLSDEPLSLYRLDLTTFVWTRQGMRISNQVFISRFTA
ncbi:hypothetical protein PRIPAC_82696 [Pristionchus pacificus]|nr:hypothetical protein PRIPAC_82696 [Pristionchus pacificus]